jgi:hypothetical protein
MQKYIVSSFLGLALLGATAQAQSTVVFDSLPDSVIGVGPVGLVPGPPDMPDIGNNLRAQSFSTGSADWTLGSIALSLEAGSGTTGGFTVNLWSDSDSTPGTLLGTLAGNDNPGTGLYSYTGAFALNPNSTYWVVTDVAADYTGDVFGWVGANAGTTVGSTVGAGYSSDGGATWGTDSSTSFLMQVIATPTVVPEPSSIVLGVMGGAGCLLFRRRK